MRSLIVAVCLLLVGCSNSQGSDGYTFEQDSRLLVPEREVVAVLYPSKEAVRKGYNQRLNVRKLGPNEDMFGFSVINDKLCTIHMLDPKVEYRPEQIGHEYAHCLYGEWHRTQNHRG